MTAPVLTRALDTVERFWFVRALYGGGICVGVAIVDGPLDRERAEAAARRLPHRHALLGARIVGDDDPRFEPGGCEAAPPSWREGDPESDWIAVADDEIATPFTADGPLWRLSIVSSGRERHAAVIAIHHAIVDGHSYFRLLREFFELCGDNADPAPVAPLPPLSALVSLTPRKPAAAGHAPRRIFPVLGRAPAEQRRTHTLARQIGAADHARVQERLKRERTTIHAALCTAALFATYDTVGPYSGLQLISPVSLRPFCRPPVPSANIGCYASGMAVFSDITEPVDFWERTRLYHRELYGAMKVEAWRMDPLDDPAAVRAAREGHARMIADPELQGRIGDIVISSSANIDPGTRWGAFAPIGAYEAAAQHTTGHHFGIYPHTVGDRLCVSAVHVAPVCPTDYAEAFIDRVVDRLVESC